MLVLPTKKEYFPFIEIIVYLSGVRLIKRKVQERIVRLM